MDPLTVHDTLVDSSPRTLEPWPDDSLHLPHVPGAKLRLMCSYGGHIMPRPHDKSLSYIGGDTRIVAVDRHFSLKDLCSRLSRTLLHGRPFTLKYHLPNEDLDNLITVATDEDLHIMFEEYDRLVNSVKPSPSRIRLFLFFNKPETALSMGPLLDDANSETWFVDALNNSSVLSRGLSDSAAVDCLLNLDSSGGGGGGENKTESPVVENVSSFGSASSSSSSSMANLPPIRIRVDENGSGRVVQLAEENLHLERDMYAAAAVVTSAAVTATAVSGENVIRKPPLPLQIAQPRTMPPCSLPSPDSVASDSSIASANSFSKIVYYQDQVQPTHVEHKGPTTTLPNTKSEISDHNQTGLQGEPIQDPGYTSPQQLDQNHQQQQFVYIHHPRPSGAPQVPIPSYYSLYNPQPSQQQLHHQISQQHYPVYVMPVGTTQQYNNMNLQSNLSDPNVVASNRPIIAQSGAASAPVYPTQSEVASVYKTPVASNPGFVQIPCNQFQQQYVGLPQHIHHPPQPIAVAPTTTTNYGYEYGGPGQEQVYYTQQQGSSVTQPTQYQSMTPAAAAAALSDASKQFPIDNIQQPSRAQQPV